MRLDIRGMGLTRLSDQIIIDKCTLLIPGPYADKATAIMAAAKLLYRSRRFGETEDTDNGYDASAKPSNMPQHFRSHLELNQESGYSLRKSGRSTSGNKSYQKIDYHLILHHRK